MRISDWSSDVCASDLRYKIVGRSRFSERYVGTPATASLTEEIRKATRNFFFSLDKEGGLAYTAFSPSPYSGWTAALDRKSVVEGKRVSVRVDPGVRRIFKQKIQCTKIEQKQLH